MGTLVFVCPSVGVEVSTGVEMDAPTLKQLESAKVYCRHWRGRPFAKPRFLS